MQIRDRIKELRRVPAGQLRPNPRNWRTHSPQQRDALQSILAEVGYAGALLARELPDGSLELIDGHLRAETTPDAMVPVLVLDVNEAEANLVLATHDPLANMAGTSAEALEALLNEVQTDSPAIQAMWNDMTEAADILPEDESDAEAEEIDINSLFQVVIECRDDSEQQKLYERLTAEGLKCRVLTL